MIWRQKLTLTNKKTSKIFSYIFYPEQTVAQDDNASKLKQIIGNMSEKQTPFIERRHGCKVLSSVEEKDETGDKNGESDCLKYWHVLHALLTKRRVRFGSADTLFAFSIDLWHHLRCRTSPSSSQPGSPLIMGKRKRPKILHQIKKKKKFNFPVVSSVKPTEKHVSYWVRVDLSRCWIPTWDYPQVILADALRPQQPWFQSFIANPLK